MKTWLTTKTALFYKIIVLIVPVLSFLLACNNKTEDHSNLLASDLEEYYEFQGFDFEPYDIPATIMLPDETANIGASTAPDVIHLKDDFYWNIHVGQNFQLYIEDYGDNTNLVAEHKKKLKNTQFYDVKYLLEEPNLIIYEITLKVRGKANASKSVGVKHVSYHVYGEQVVDGIHYELRSRDEGFDLNIIELMAKSIRSFKGKSKKEDLAQG